MRHRVGLLLGKRRKSVVVLAVCSIFSGFTEAGTLALIAQIASTLVTGKKVVHFDHAGLHIHASLGSLILVAFGLVILRLLLQFPLSILPARIAANVQGNLRTTLFDSFTRASWAVQSQDREGQLQETTTSQVMSATAGALQATSLITSSFMFLVLLGSAVALNPLAAVIVASASVALFGLLRPLRSRGVANSRELSKAQVEYAGGVAESIRVAEETHVFGVVSAQRERIARLVANSERFYYRSQLLNRFVSNFYQSLIYILLVGGIAGLTVAGRNHAGSLAGVVLVLLRAGTAGQLVQGAYQGLSQSLPFIERTQAAIKRYNDSSPVYGSEPLTRVGEVSFEQVTFGYDAERPVLSEISFDVAGGEVIGPGDGTTPVQWIDVRDLAAFVVKTIEDKTVGTYNAFGPPQPTTIKTVLDACNEAGGNKAQITWVEGKFLTDHDVQGWRDLPMWVDNKDPDDLGFGTKNNSRALAKGLACRPVLETAKDTLAWLATLPEDERAKVASSGVKRDKELEVLAAWHARPH